MISGLKYGQSKFKETQMALFFLTSPLSRLPISGRHQGNTFANNKEPGQAPQCFRDLLRWCSLRQGSAGHRTHFKGLRPLLLLDVFHALIALLLEVVSLLLIQQANLEQEWCIALYDLRRKEANTDAAWRERDVREAHLLVK